MEDLKTKQKQLQTELDKINRQLLAAEDETFSAEIDEALTDMGFTRKKGGHYIKTIDNQVELYVEREDDGEYYFQVNHSNPNEESFTDSFPEDQIIEAIATFKIWKNTVTLGQQTVFYTIDGPADWDDYSTSDFDWDEINLKVTPFEFKAGDTIENLG